MANSETTFDKSLDIPLGAAVSAKFRGAFCEAIVNKIEKNKYCRIQFDDKKIVKVRAEDVVGSVIVSSKVKVQLDGELVAGTILKIFKNDLFHVVFNDGDTGILRRNQLVLKGDRHYKLSECLDRHPLTNPDHFTKAVVNDKRQKEKSDVDEEEFDNDEVKSCSQESMTTVSSSKTRSRQQTVASSASVGTGISSITAKTIEDTLKTPSTKIKTTKIPKTKYSIGSLVIVSKITCKLDATCSDLLDKRTKAFVGLIVPSSLFDSEVVTLKSTQCAVKSFRDNYSYAAYKRDLQLVVRRDLLLKHRDSDPLSASYVDKSLLYFDAKILPDSWDSGKWLPITDCQVADDDLGDSERVLTKVAGKSKPQSPRTSLSSLDSSSSEDDNDNHESDNSNEDDQNAKDEWVARFYGFWEDKGSPINSALEIMDSDVDIYRLYELVKDYGGFQKVTSNIRWPHLYHLMKLPHAASENYQKLQMLYKRYIFPYVDMKKKLGTFEQIRTHRLSSRVAGLVQKARPLLSARDRREYQQTVKKTETYSVSSPSACDRTTEKVISDDEVVTDMARVSPCSSSPKQEPDRLTDPAPQQHSLAGVLVPGTLVSVAYGDDKIYKAKILNQHIHDPKVYPKTPAYQSLLSTDSASNAGSANSVVQDQKCYLEGATMYRVHYIGWNTRHDEIITPDRILGVLSDTCQDSHSACSSSRGSRHMVPLSDTETPMQASQLQTDEPFVSSAPDGGDLLPDISDVSHDIESPDSGQANDIESKTESAVVMECDPSPTLSQEPPKPATIVNYKRHRSRSACVVEPDHIIIKRLPIVPESRIIASLNLYKTEDKMPKRPTRTFNAADESQNVKRESDVTVTESSSASKRHSNTTDDSEISPKVSKIESVVSEKMKTERHRSPSFSNESLSDASTVSFRHVDDQYLFYMSHDDTAFVTRKIEPKSVKVLNKRGRKPSHRNVEKKPLVSASRRLKDQKAELVEMESNSSQHSGSGHGKRVTRSLKTASDQNTVDDNSVHLEEDSQTSQDGSALHQTPEARTLLMTPLAAGTPTSSHKGRRTKTRRKKANSHSNSSVEGAYQDTVGDQNNISAIENVVQPKASDTSPVSKLHNRPAGRAFQRLHPSLIPQDLQKLPPDERVKLLESLVRQTHFNFVDTKNRLRYVEKRILEIKSSRANGHSIESDEDKFR